MINNLLRNLRYDWPLHFILLFTNWLPDNVVFLRLRGSLACPFLGSCGGNFRVARNVTIYNPSNVHIGRDVYIGYGCWFVVGNQIKIEDEVMFGPYVVLSAGNHTRINGSYRFGPTEYIPITIGRGTWIGSNATILGGASIGAGCLVGSNACVTRGNVPDHSFVAGVPAEVKKMMD